MRIHIKTIRTDKGVIAYRANEKVNEKSLIFIHGLGGDSKLFHNQLRHFSEDFHVIGIDLPGHGRSLYDRLPNRDDFINAVRRVMNEERVEKSVLIGHSMGGGICLDLYSRESQDIEAMILISTGAVLPVSGELYAMLERDMEDFIDYFVGATFSSNAGLLASLAKNDIGENDKEIIKNDLAICESMDYSYMLGSIIVPVLIVANKHDRVVPLHITSFLNEKITSSQMKVFNLGGHIPHFDHKKTFNDTVDSFFSEIFY